MATKSKSNIPPSQSQGRLLRGGSCDSSEIEHCLQNATSPVSLGDYITLPNHTEDEEDAYCNSTEPARFKTPVSNADHGNQMDTDLNSQSIVANRIQEVFTKGLTSLDLSNQQLGEVPKSIFIAHNIMYLYLANNQISILPEGLFEHFPVLRWLDLRHNCLTHLPSISDRGHDELRCLLIEGNAIRRLPLQLGCMCKLHGLNIYNNPIEFPPSHIIKKGTREMLQYLHDIYIEENPGKYPYTDQQEATSELEHKTYKKRYTNSKRNSETRGGKYEQTFDRIPLKPREDSHRSALRRNYMNIERLLQQKRDQDSLKKFHDEYRQTQTHRTSLNIEVPDLLTTAPFGISADRTKMISRKDITRAPEKRQPLPDLASYKSKQKPLNSRAMYIEELEEKIKSHYLKMHERRKQTHNSFIDEVKAIKQDLDKAKYLQNELILHRNDLEYRFKAFTPDIPLTSISQRQ